METKMKVVTVILLGAALSIPAFANDKDKDKAPDPPPTNTPAQDREIADAQRDYWLSVAKSIPYNIAVKEAEDRINSLIIKTMDDNKIDKTKWDYDGVKHVYSAHPAPPPVQPNGAACVGDACKDAPKPVPPVDTPKQ
jgi:hypothetical protein